MLGLGIILQQNCMLNLIRFLISIFSRKSKVIHDATFGEMQYSKVKVPGISVAIENCDFQYFFKPVNHEIKISITAGSGGPTEFQKNSLLQVEKEYNVILQAVEYFFSKQISVNKIQNYGLNIKDNFKLVSVDIGGGDSLEYLSWSLYYEGINSKDVSLSVDFIKFEVEEISLNIFSEGGE